MADVEVVCLRSSELGPSTRSHHCAAQSFTLKTPLVTSETSLAIMDSNTIYDEADGQSYGWLSDHLFAPTPDRFNTDLDTTDFGEYQFPTFDAAYCNKFPNFVDIRDKQYTSGPPSAFTVSSATGTDVSSIDPSVLSYSASSEDQNIADIGLAWFNLKPTPDTINSVHGMQATDNSFPENEPPTTLDPSNMFLNISVPSAISPPLALMDLISVPAVSNKAVHRANSTLKHIANKKNLKNRYSCPECSLCALFSLSCVTRKQLTYFL